MNQEQIQLLYNPNLFPEYHLFYVLKEDEDKKICSYEIWSYIKIHIHQ